MAYQRFDGTMSFLPSRFEAQAMLSEMQKKKDEEMKLQRLKQAEEQKHQTEALRSELNRMLTELKAMTANREATMSRFFSQTSIPPRPPFPPPDPPDYKTKPTSKTSTKNKIPLRYSCEEIYERMEKGFCIFCEDLDTPGHYNLKHKRSKLCLIESVGDESPDDEKPCEVTVEEIADKSVDMNREEESNSENESRPEFSHQVLLSQVQHTPTNQYRAPFNPCQNHSDKPHNKSKFGNCIGHEIEFDREGDEIEDDELQDKQIEQIVETLVMNEGEQPLDTTRHNNLPNEMATSLGLVGGDDQEDNTKLTSLGLVGGDDQEDNTKFARKKNNSETKIEFSSSDPSCFVALVTTSNSARRECREIVLTDNGDRAWALELRFNQVGNGEIRVLNLCPAEKARKESFPVEVMHWINKKNEAEYSPNEKIVYTLTSGLCQAKRDHEEIRVLEKLIQPEFSLDLLDCSSLTGLFCKPKLEVEITVLLEGNMNIKRATFFGRNVVKWKCWLVVESRLPLHYWVAWRKLIVWEVLCILQNNAHRLLLVIHELQKGKLWFSSSNGRIGTANGELQEWNDVVAGHLLFDMVEKSNYLDEVIEEVAKTFILAMINEHKDIKTACVFLEKGLNRERLIQLGAPPVFSDLLCVMNRIRVRLKMVLLLEFLWLILSTSKMFKSSNVHQNKNQTDQKLSSYWKLLLWLLHPLHINRWRSFFNVAVISCSSYVKVLELIKDKASRKRKLCKNWWFKYKLNTWLSEALHLWRKRKSEKLQRAKHMMCELIQNSWDMSIFGKSRTSLRCKMRIVHGLENLRHFTRAGIKFHLKHKWRSKFGSSKLTRTWTNYSRYDSSSCVLQQEENYVMVLFPIAGTADISIGEFRSVCKLLFGIFVLNLITEQVHGWSFFGLLLQWKWHPPPQTTSEFHQAHNAKPCLSSLRTKMI